MTSRLRRRSRHRLHKTRNKVRGWRRRNGYNDRSHEWPTLLEAVQVKLSPADRIPMDALASVLAARNSILDDLVWMPAPEGPYRTMVTTPLPPVPPGFLDYDMPEE